MTIEKKGESIAHYVSRTDNVSIKKGRKTVKKLKAYQNKKNQSARAHGSTTYKLFGK
jgi:hypothetical protein